jgi:hypothetical protein
VSRYVIEREIGVGAGGVVYQAFDPQLKRRVACKLLRTDRGGGPSPGQERLLREAEAMARLSHPNVVNVFDAGTHEGHVFIVMELVGGETLARWLRRQPRGWREATAAFVDAGRGLAAAHAVGLVHRDFKPENVLVGEDARVRVTDFGLARPVSIVQGADTPGVQPARDSLVTTAAGTPAYMAPELFLGGVADARSDQFSFCVALFWALHGRHPSGKNDAGAKPPAHVPEALTKILSRGLAAAPADRFPSMDDLIAAIARVLEPPRPRAPRAAIAGGAALVVAVAAWAALGRGGHTPARSSAAAACGNGVVDPGEECDDGNGAADDACVACRWARCGDGKVRRGVEACDPADPATRGGCSATCLRCTGDGAFPWDGNGHCYTRHDRALPWDGARAACHELGGTLVTLVGTFESRAVREGLFAQERRPVWIGMSYRRNQHAWITGEPQIDRGVRQPPQLTDWLPGFPDPSRGTCVQGAPVAALHPNPSARGGLDYANAPCEQPLGYVCEQEAWTVRPATHHAYHVFDGTSVWHEARDACAARGAHLVTIADAEEQAFVAALSPGLEVWIGATDEKEEGHFVWVTGEPFGYAHFSPGEPDNQFGNDDYVVLGNDQAWHDRPAERRPFTCEID